MRSILQLECAVCRHRNYSTTKNKTRTPGKLEKKKFCRSCRKHTVHKETK